MQQHGWVSKTLGWEKKVRLKKLHTEWFHLYDIMEKEKTRQKLRSMVAGS